MSNSGKAKLLLVDDEPFFLRILVEALSDEYQLVVAKNGEQALKRLNSGTQCDLVLLDVMMPVMDGYHTIEQMKKTPEISRIPVIFMTAKTDEQEQKLGRELGAVDYITKPLDVPALKARIRAVLETGKGSS
jgi:putative two-component system response regulator